MQWLVMKYSPSLSLVVCLVLAVVNIRVETKEIDFHVSPMEGKEDVYYRLKRRSPSVRHPVEEKHKTKEKICAAILESNFFDSLNVELVDPHHPDVHDKIKKHDPKMFHKHFNRSHHSDANHELKFLNPYVLNDVLVHGLFIREWLFLCLAKNVKTHSIQQYFVSPMHHTTDGKVVRFVFAQNDRKEMVLIARAEGNSSVHHDHRAQTTPATGTTKAGKKEEETEDDDYSESSEEDDSYEDEEEYENDTDEEKDDEDEYDDTSEEYSDEKNSDE